MERLADLPDLAKKVIFGVVAVAIGVLVVFANLDDPEPALDNPAGTGEVALADGEVVAQQEAPSGAPTAGEGTETGEVVSIESPVGENALRDAGELAVEFVQTYVGYDWRDDAEDRFEELSEMAAENNTLNTTGVSSLFAQDRQVVTTVAVESAQPTLVSPSSVVYAVRAATSTTSEGSDEALESDVVLVVTLLEEQNRWKVVSLSTVEESERDSTDESIGEFQDGGTGGQ